MVDHPPADPLTDEDGRTDHARDRPTGALAGRTSPRTTRRRFLAAGAATALTGLAGCLSVVSTGPGDLGLYAAATADGSEQWIMDLPELEASPTLVDGTVYVGLGETLHALSPADGSELWTSELELPGFPAFSRPTKAGDLVLVPGEEEFLALSASDGSEQWRFGSGYSVWVGTPVADGTAVVGAGDTDVNAISLSDGSLQWQFKGEQLAENSAAVAGDTVVVNSRAGRVHGLSLADGSERWTYETDSAAAGRPAVCDGTVYVGTTGRWVYALDAADGTEQWRLDTSGGEGNTAIGDESYPRPRFVDGRVYVHAENEVLFVVGPGGREQWRLNADFNLGFEVAGGTTYAAATRTESDSTGPATNITNHPMVYALDGGGNEQWATEMDGKRVASPPGVGSDAVYVGLQGGSVHALSRADGSERWTSEPGVVEDRPMVVDGTVVLAARA